MALGGTDYDMREVMEAIKTEVLMAQDGNAELVPTIVGDPGIGKSASMKGLAKEMNLDCFIISLGALPMEWFSGLPDFVNTTIKAEYHSEGKTEIKTTEWTMSDLVRSINRHADMSTEPIYGEPDASGNRHIVQPARDGLMVLLDDLHLVEPLIQKYLFEFFQNKTLQNFKLSDKAYLVAAMNGKDSAGLEDFHSAVINRMAFYFAKFDKDYWYEKVGFNLHPYVSSFAKGPNGNYFSGANSTESQSPSPRTWTDLSAIIPYLESRSSSLGDLNAKLQMAAEARVGAEAAVAFMSHVKIFQKFDFRSILDKKDPDFTISGDTSEQILTSFIIRYVSSKEDAAYLKVILEKNLSRRAFISIFMNEFTTLYSNLDALTDGNAKEGFIHLTELLTAEEAVNSNLLDIVVDALMDIKN